MTLTKYIEKAKTFKGLSRWESIAMQNMADEIPVSEIPQAMETCRNIAINVAEERVAKLTALKTPSIIMDHEVKKLDKARAGKSDIESILRRSLNKRSK